jgi:uncharacterized protein YndB with AHSA1/START domain
LQIVVRIGIGPHDVPAKEMTMYTIENHIDIHATPANIFAALTTKEGVATWWTDDCDVSASEATYRFAKPDRDRESTWRVDERTGSRVAMTCIREVNTPDWLGTKLSFALEPRGAITRVSLVHAGYRDKNEMYEQCTAGWAYFLGSLKKLLETGTGEPFKRPGSHSIVQEVVIAGDADRIHDALMTAAGVRAWWTRECQISSAEHVYSFTEVSSRFRVDRDEPRKVVLRCVEDNGMGWLGSTLTYTLAPAGSATRFTLEHTGIRDKKVCEVCTHGWTFFVGSLKNLIETGRGTPAPENMP